MHLISQEMFVTVPKRMSILLSYSAKLSEHNQKEIHLQSNVTNIVFPLVRGEVGPFVLIPLSKLREKEAR